MKGQHRCSPDPASRSGWGAAAGMLACPQRLCFPEHAPEWPLPLCTPGPRLVVPKSGLPQHHPAVPEFAGIQGTPFLECPMRKIPFHMQERQPFFSPLSSPLHVFPRIPGEYSFVPQIHPSWLPHGASAGCLGSDLASLPPVIPCLSSPVCPAAPLWSQAPPSLARDKGVSVPLRKA